MSKKRTIRTIPQQRTPMTEQEPHQRARNFDEVACGYTQDARSKRKRCLLCPDPPCVRAARSTSTSPISSRRSAIRTSAAPTTSSTDSNLLPAVCGRVCPQENAVRGRVHGRRLARAGRDRPAGALGRRPGDHARAGSNVPLHRAQRLPRRHCRLRARRHGLRGRHGQGRLRRHRLRGLPSSRAAS